MDIDNDILSNPNDKCITGQKRKLLHPKFDSPFKKKKYETQQNLIEIEQVKDKLILIGVRLNKWLYNKANDVKLICFGDSKNGGFNCYLNSIHHLLTMKDFDTKCNEIFNITNFKIEKMHERFFILFIDTLKQNNFSIQLSEDAWLFTSLTIINITINGETIEQGRKLDKNKTYKFKNIYTKQNNSMIIFIGVYCLLNQYNWITNKIADELVEPGDNIITKKKKNIIFNNNFLTYKFSKQLSKYTSIKRNNSNQTVLHLMKKQEYKYYDETPLIKLTSNMKCCYCVRPNNPSEFHIKSITGLGLCQKCQNYGCYTHFGKNMICIKCIFIQEKWPLEKYNEKCIEDNIRWITLYFDKETKCCYGLGKIDKNFKMYSNISRKVEYEIIKKNGDFTKGFLKIKNVIDKIDERHQEILQDSGITTKKFITKLKQIYDININKCEKDKYIDIYNKIPNEPELKTKISIEKTSKRRYIIRKYIKTLNGDEPYGLAILCNAIHNSVSDRAKEWTEYFQHCTKRDTSIINKFGDSIGRIDIPNPHFVYNHENSIEGYYKYNELHQIKLLNRSKTLFNTGIRIVDSDRTYSKLQLGRYYHTEDNNGFRCTYGNDPDVGGIDYDKLYGFTSFKEELFQIGKRTLSLLVHGQINETFMNQIEWNSIQINTTKGLEIKTGLFSPRWHFDSKILFKYYLLGIQMTGWNIFLTNQDQNDDIKVQRMSKNHEYKERITRKIWEYGIMKIPESAYVMSGFSHENVNHSIINKKGVAIIHENYNEILKEKLTKEKHGKRIYQEFKITGNKDEILKTPTETWLFRNIGN